MSDNCCYVYISITHWYWNSLTCNCISSRKNTTPFQQFMQIIIKQHTLILMGKQRETSILIYPFSVKYYFSWYFDANISHFSASVHDCFESNLVRTVHSGKIMPYWISRICKPFSKIYCKSLIFSVHYI